MSSDFPIVFALYPRLTQLDFTAPLEVLARLPGASTVLAASRGGELSADGGVVFANVRPLDEVAACALLCVPGGFGSTAAMEAACPTQIVTISGRMKSMVSKMASPAVMEPPGELM